MQLTDPFTLPVGIGTATDAFLWAVENNPDDLALRDGDGDLALSWRQYADRVASLAAGLKGLGVAAGDRVALLMGNRPEFNLVDSAALFLGAVPFSIYPTSASEQIAYLAAHAEPAVFVVEAEARERFEAAGVSGPVFYLEDDEDGRSALARIEAFGDGCLDLHEAGARVAPNDLLTLIYTSGTTGPPKGVELSHAALVFTIKATLEAIPLPEQGRLISYLPHAHVVDRFASHYLQMATASSTTTLLDGRNVFALTPEVEPTMFFAVPRTWEKLRQSLSAELGSGAEAASVRSRIGLAEASWLVTGSTATEPELLRFFAGLGMPICENWGMSENCAVGTLNDPVAPRIGSVGRMLPGTEMTLAEDGELLYRGPNLMRGYRNDPEQTAQTIDADGWLHTGDIGEIDVDGFLSIVDRKKEIIISSSGKNMSPTNIEATLRNADPIIGQVCCVGDARPFNTALIVLDLEVAQKAASAPDGELGDLVELPAVQATVEAAVSAANGRLARVEQIRKYRVLADEWPPDGELVTPTQKVRRREVLRRYQDVVEDLYSPAVSGPSGPGR